MLQVNFLRENKERVTAGLNKRNFSYLFLYSVSPGRTDDENKRNMITCSDSFYVNSGRTGEPVEIEAKNRVSFSAAKAFKTRVNS